MPQKRSAYKEIRKSKRKHHINRATSSEVKTSVKKFNSLLDEKKIAEAKVFLKTVISKIAKAAKKGVLKKKTASRHISRLSKKLSKAAAAK